MDLIDHPFRLVGSSVATVDQESEDAKAVQLAVLMMTRRGERQMVPMFGVTDPAFQTFDASDIELGLELFGPDIAVEDIAVVFPSEGVQEVAIRYGIG